MNSDPQDRDLSRHACASFKAVNVGMNSDMWVGIYPDMPTHRAMSLAPQSIPTGGMREPVRICREPSLH